MHGTKSAWHFAPCGHYSNPTNSHGHSHLILHGIMIDLVKRVRLTHGQKLAIIAKKKHTPGCTRNELAEWAAAQFKLPARPDKTTIGRIFRSSEALLMQSPDAATRRKVITATQVMLDENVAEFVMLAEAENVVNGRYDHILWSRARPKASDPARKMAPTRLVLAPPPSRAVRSQVEESVRRVELR